MINTWQCTPLKGTHPHSCFEGNPMDKNRAPPPVAWALNILFMTRESSQYQGAVQPREQPDLCWKVPWGEEKCSEGAQKPSPFLRHGLVGGVPTGGDRFSFLQKKGWNWCPSVKKTYYKELWNILKWPSSVVWNGFSSISYFLSKCQDNLGVAAQEPSGLYQGQELVFGECRLQNTGQETLSFLEEMVCRKRHYSLESLRRSLAKAVAEIPLETQHAVTAEWPERLKACVEK